MLGLKIEFSETREHRKEEGGRRGGGGERGNEKKKVSIGPINTLPSTHK